MPIINPLTGKPHQRSVPTPEVLEIYPSEIPKVKAALEDLQRYWNQKRVSDPAEAAEAFNQMAVNKFGEIGFTVEVEWFETNDNPFAPGVPMFVPRVAPNGRTSNKETEVDHDRMQHDIVTGKADGKKGYIREDGTWHEDPIKRIIT